VWAAQDIEDVFVQAPRVELNDACSRWWTSSTSRDSMQSLNDRMVSFVHGLRYRDEQNIVAVGHSNFFFHFCR
jgi:hypothetical protein